MKPKVHPYPVFRLLLSLSFLTLLFLTFCLQPESYAAEVKVSWYKNIDPVDGYKVHYGIASGNYGYSLDVGNFTSCAISSLEAGARYFFAVTAYNLYGESTYSDEVSYTVPTAPPPPQDPVDGPVDGPVELIIDNGDKGTLSTGNWYSSTGSNCYGANSLNGYGAGTRYGYEASVSGECSIALWWTNNGYLRCSSVPVEIYDGARLLDTVHVNQQRNGGQWNDLGTYTFTGTARVAVVSKGGCVTVVDAVEFAFDDSVVSDVYRITASSGSGGSISPSGEVVVESASSISYTIQSDVGYHISNVKVDGSSVGAVTSYAFENVSSDHTIEASFEADSTSGGLPWWKWWRR